LPTAGIKNGELVVLAKKKKSLKTTPRRVDTYIATPHID
jgi:hypothetical protein